MEWQSVFNCLVLSWKIWFLRNNWQNYLHRSNSYEEEHEYLDFVLVEHFQPNYVTWSTTHASMLTFCTTLGNCLLLLCFQINKRGTNAHCVTRQWSCY